MKYFPFLLKEVIMNFTQMSCPSVEYKKRHIHLSVKVVTMEDRSHDNEKSLLQKRWLSLLLLPW